MSPVHGKGRMSSTLGARDPRVRRGMNQFDRPELVLNDGIWVDNTGLISVKLGTSSRLSFDSSGGLVATVGAVSGSLASGTDARFMSGVEPSHCQRVWKSVLGNSASPLLLVSGTAYFVYVGRVVKALTPKYIEFHVTTAGAGTQTAEVALYSTSSAPNKSAQTLSLITGTGTVDDLTGTGMKRNTTAFSTSIAANTHLWAGIRTAMGTTQPTIVGLANDMSQGHIMSLSGASALV